MAVQEKALWQHLATGRRSFTLAKSQVSGLSEQLARLQALNVS